MARHAIWCGRLDEADKLLSGAGAAGAVPGRVLALSALAALWRGDSESQGGEGGSFYW